MRRPVAWPSSSTGEKRCEGMLFGFYLADRNFPELVPGKAVRKLDGMIAAEPRDTR